MNRLSTERRRQIVACLVEGNSIRATCRMTGAAKNTVVKLLCGLGWACADYHRKHVRGVSCERIQCDEIWCFCYAKARNVPAEKAFERGVGSVWTWTALCADTKLVPSWLVGGRDAGHATSFLCDLASRLDGRVQLTTDGNAPYINAVHEAFGEDVDYAMLIKLFGPSGNHRHPETRYSEI